jgi:outer membrane protein OmpA-like peptidoglycan-associated protein
MAEQQRAAPVVTGIVAAIVTVVVLAGASWLAYPAIDKRIDEKIAALDARLTGEIAAASAKSRQPGAAARLDGDLAAVNKELAAIKTTLAQQSQGAAANGKLDQALASLSRLDAITQSLGALNTQLAAIKTAAGDAGANRDVLAAVKSNVDGLKADIASIKGEIGGLGNVLAALKTDLTAVKTAAAARADLVKDAGVMTTASTPQGRDLTIVSITRTAEVPAHPVAPLNVYFNRVGARDDKGQTEAIVQRLKETIKGRSDCTIAVTGHADTLGNDDFNLALSKARAEEVAAKLKTAFAGDHVTITETGRGERALETWTPDNTPRKTNRRVEIDVTCKS